MSNWSNLIIFSILGINSNVPEARGVYRLEGKHKIKFIGHANNLKQELKLLVLIQQAYTCQFQKILLLKEMSY